MNNKQRKSTISKNPFNMIETEYYICHVQFPVVFVFNFAGI